jgi:hypothetical protein
MKVIEEFNDEQPPTWLGARRIEYSKQFVKEKVVLISYLPISRVRSNRNGKKDAVQLYSRFVAVEQVTRNTLSLAKPG